MDVPVQLLQLALQVVEFASGQFGHLRVPGRDQFLVLGHLFLDRLGSAVITQQLLQAQQFAREVTGAALIGVHRRIGELGLEFTRSLAEFIDVG